MGENEYDVLPSTVLCVWHYGSYERQFQFILVNQFHVLVISSLTQMILFLLTRELWRTSCKKTSIELERQQEISTNLLVRCAHDNVISVNIFVFHTHPQPQDISLWVLINDQNFVWVFCQCSTLIDRIRDYESSGEFQKISY
jgi:hypothetical protein